MPSTSLFTVLFCTVFVYLKAGVSVRPRLSLPVLLHQGHGGDLREDLGEAAQILAPLQLLRRR